MCFYCAKKYMYLFVYIFRHKCNVKSERNIKKTVVEKEDLWGP